jgi:prepilin-type N-terminal cleavage/methylation domain-containing protein
MMNSKAFTLIELLVVVAIIGILAAVGVVAYNGYTGSAKSNRANFDHNQAVRQMKTLLFSCETQGYVNLKTGSGDSTSDFQCSTGASNLKVQFTVHFYLSGFRNSWTFRKGVQVQGIKLDDYMIGFSCNQNPDLGFMNLCDVSPTQMYASTNVGTSKGANKVITTYFDIPK